MDIENSNSNIITGFRLLYKAIINPLNPALSLHSSVYIQKKIWAVSQVKICSG